VTCLVFDSAALAVALRHYLRKEKVSLKRELLEIFEYLFDFLPPLSISKRASREDTYFTSII
jgi:hypothetical protein